MQRKWARRSVAALIGLLLTLVLFTPGLAIERPSSAKPTDSLTSPSPAKAVVPLENQPFYPDLLDTLERWQGVQLEDVVGDSPRSTLLNFYAVMAEVGQQVREISATANTDPGLFWSPQAHKRINSVDHLFKLAVKALDGTVFPGSVRQDMTEEAAIKLKQVLDFVFSTSQTSFSIPDATEIDAKMDGSNNTVTSWHLPNTSIALSSSIQTSAINQLYLFSAETVKNVEQMYTEIEQLPVAKTRFSTPGFYQGFSTTPGYLIPPKWYLRFPPELRQLMEIELWGQTLFQIFFSVVAISIQLLFVGLLTRRLLHSYRYLQDNDLEANADLNYDNLCWQRVILTLPILPIVKLTSLVVDNNINITGTPLVVLTYAFTITYFLSAIVLCLLLFEALGSSSAEWLMHLRRETSPLMLQRINNLVLPITRTIGAFSAVALLYRLLIVLGLPPNTVLAFSAVPGLAIGLGASKLLGNLFAGLSIQTDRPLRVGEFCRVGENLGFVTKIGLRSLELQTLESRVTIPNSIADEATIVNFSERTRRSDSTPSQGLELRYPIEHHLSPDQVETLLFYARKELKNRPELTQTLVSIERSSDERLSLICFATVELHGWRSYLEIRESLLLRLHEILEQVDKSRVVIGVSYDSTPEQLELIPELLRNALEADANFKARSCRLMSISTYSYDFVLTFLSTHPSYSLFKDGINRLNQAIIISFASNGIDIPFPTQIEISKDKQHPNPSI